MCDSSKKNNMLHCDTWQKNSLTMRINCYFQITRENFVSRFARENFVSIVLFRHNSIYDEFKSEFKSESSFPPFLHVIRSIDVIILHLSHSIHCIPMYACLKWYGISLIFATSVEVFVFMCSSTDDLRSFSHLETSRDLFFFIFFIFTHITDSQLNKNGKRWSFHS